VRSPEPPAAPPAAEPEPPAESPAEAARALVADGNFRRLWFAGTFSGVMRWLEMLAVAVYVHEVTGSAFLVSLMFVLRMLPLTLFSAFAGALGDRFSRRGLLMAGMTFMSVQSLVLAVLVLTDTVEIWHIGLSAVFGGLFWATEMPLRRTLMGEFAGPNRVGNAMSFEAITNNATRMAGPLIGGGLLALLGIQGAFLLGMIFYAISCGLMAVTRVDHRPTASGGIRAVLANVAEGLGIIRRSPALVGTLSITIVYNLWGYPFTAMVPVIARDVLGLGEFSVGLIASAEGLGALIGAVVVLLVAKPEIYRRLYIAGVLLNLLMVLAFSHTPWPVLAGLVLLGAGIGGAGFSTMQATLVFLQSPPEARARIMGVLTVCIGVAPLGFVNVGLMAYWLGAPAAVAITAIEGLLAWCLANALWPQIHARGRVVSPPPLASSPGTPAAAQLGGKSRPADRTP